VGVYTRQGAQRRVAGYGGGEFDAEGRYVELRFDTPAAQALGHQRYFPSGSSGEDRQQAKFRFLAGCTRTCSA
jgi:exodeoxyribonuclease-3